MLSRDLVIDACAVINLIRGNVARQCLTAIEPRPSVTPAIRSECENKSATPMSLKDLFEHQCLHCLDEVLTSDEVVAFMEKHDLGAGESEGILVCLALKKHFWSDDRRARERAIELLTRAAVIGTAGMLRELVKSGDITRDQTIGAYRTMRELGGYQPNFPDGFFDNA